MLSLARMMTMSILSKKTDHQKHLKEESLAFPRKELVKTDQELGLRKLQGESLSKESKKQLIKQQANSNSKQSLKRTQ